MLIICNGMPRSGSTALYNRVRDYLAATRAVRELGFLDCDRLVTEEKDLLAKAHADEPFVLKTHYELPASLGMAVTQGQVFEAYTVRNLRDIAISMRRVWKSDEAEIATAIALHGEVARRMAGTDRVAVLRFEDIDGEKGLELLRQVSAHAGRTFSEDAGRAAQAKGRDTLREARARPVSQLKSSWFHFALRLNARLKLGRFLKMVLPASKVQSLKERALLIDSKTMLHPEHIATSAPSADDRALGDRMAARFADWQRDFSYG